VKISIFSPMFYKDVGVPHGAVPPSALDATRTPEALARAFELYDLADAAGFDWLAVGEHHTAAAFTPNPITMAAAMAVRYPRPRIAVLGVIVPMINPVRTAEEFAMVDAISGGRLVAGLFRGIPNEYLVYGVNPAESRSLFEEGVEFVLAALSEPEPFGWEGRHFRYRDLAVWPRPVQQPRPPVFGGGQSERSATVVARNRMGIGLTFVLRGAAARRLVDLHRQVALRTGWDPTPADVLYRARCYVAETDERAVSEAREYRLGELLPLDVPPEKQASLAKVMAAVFSQADRSIMPSGDAVPLPEYVGSPDTVARQIREDADTIGFGVVDLMFDGVLLPHALAVRSLELFNRRVLPQLRG
jgi:alkanesulfonate monooxygenase SsuD/methylene tetrahydromethanopterin reductase-like flavin-dependent oxidoreductase (luciferase family)